MRAAQAAAFYSVGAAYQAARGAYDAAHANYAGQAVSAAIIAATTNPAVAVGVAVAARAAVWDDVRTDAVALQSGADPTATPLWPATPPDWFTEADTRARAIWSRDPGLWEFWLRWWDGMLAGKPLDWTLQRDVALIPDDDWQKGPAYVAAIIANIELRNAIARTPNGEDVEVNPGTGRLRLVPVTDLGEDIATYARRKIRRAAEMFGIYPGNQYTALTDDLRMLREAASDPEMTPVELFDACASASRRLTKRVARHECPVPEEDALIYDYATRIREAGADILGNDPQTQAVLTARHAITGTASLVDDRETILRATGLILPVTEGLLAKRLPEDAATATSPDADVEDRQAAVYRFSSRVLRIARLAGGTVLQGASVVAGGAVLEALWASPPFQALLQNIYRFLGF